MKNIKNIIISAFVGIFVFSSAGCGMISKTPEAIKKAPIAKVDTATITKEELDQRLAPDVATMVSQYGSDWQKNSTALDTYKQQRDQMVDDMINEQLIILKAKAGNGFPKQSDIDAETTKQIQSTKDTYQEQFETALKSAGYTVEQYTAFVKQQITVQKCVEFLTKDVKVDDSKVQAEYDTNKNVKYTTKDNLMHLEHILVASEAEANAAIARIKKGESFEAVAKAVSTDTGSKDSGGDLGDYYYNDDLNQNKLDATFLKAAMAVPQGQISAPVQTQYGWHVIKCTKREEYPAKPFSEVKDTIKASLLETAKSTAINDDLTKWKKELGSKIKKYTNNY